ncbi:MAG: hypothetical protein B6D59_01460 [Campylobacteraceae bacterium 4484_4]|nr:MAG: hypothetical protein B6D59_01460 [Campylobacteraceae bacterium 4484_4]
MIRKTVTAIFATLLLLLGGCSAKTGLFAPDRMEQKALHHTQRGEIYNALEIKAAIVATYLNPVYPKYDKSEKEYFLIGIYIDNDASDIEHQGIYNEQYRLRLAGEKPVKITPLKESDALVKSAPLRNRWSHYYLVEFPPLSTQTLELTYQNDQYGKVTLHFAKE